MLSKAQERVLRDLQTKKGRRDRGMFLIEGEKFVRDAKRFVEFSFTPRDTNQFREYVTTEAPQSIAAVARIPQFTLEDVLAKDIVVVLDNVQDPGNVGTILRACLGFGASAMLVESADVTNPKVVRSSASAILKTPWIEVKRGEAEEILEEHTRQMYRLENRSGAISPEDVAKEKMYMVVGNEGSGIQLGVSGKSVRIAHAPALDSLNVAVAASIILYTLSKK